MAAGLHYDIPIAHSLGFSTFWNNCRADDPADTRPDIILRNLHHRFKLVRAVFMNIGKVANRVTIPKAPLIIHCL